MNILNLGNVSTKTTLDINKVANENVKGSSFKNFLTDALDKVNQLQIEAENYKKLLATGQVENIHEVMIAAEKANIAMQFTLAIRNKVVDAYREIMRMQI
jgi:flagellar hook-basal body complex protein FliE